MPESDTFDHMNYLEHLVKSDLLTLREKEKSYGGSWKKRGGVGAFFVLCRKWDRLETWLGKVGFDIFEAIRSDLRPEPVIEDIRDLRRYLLLVEAEMIRQGALKLPPLPEPRKIPVSAAATAVGMTHPFGFDAALDIPSGPIESLAGPKNGAER